ncbi:hypothetical protein [Streptomyces lanatus]|uniref:Uncharacterized protein n=1 Tax=Streptomyces lanatus TaxID=66900 RepID=A0ABV1Y7U7_9ACTN|nr:hypothetical protein [Streptomyces lanatus]GHG98534.1 hypothetical protein GCM10018780_24350 [Streptomyces lanatus]
MSAIQHTGRGIEGRVVAMSGNPVVAIVSGPFTDIDTIDLPSGLLGSEPATAGRHDLRLAPWEIRSVVLRSAT